MYLRRTEFLLLTELTRPRFDAYARRDQLPLSADDGVTSRYSVFEAFLQIAINDLCDDPKQESRSAAKATVCAVAPTLAARWQDIVASAADPALPEIVWVRLTHKHSDEGPRLSNLVGTADEVGAAIALTPDFRKIDGGSATACAAILIRRANEQAIELPEDFFSARPTFVTEDDTAVDALWSRAVADAAAKREAV